VVTGQVKPMDDRPVDRVVARLDSIETAQREIRFFFPEFDVHSVSDYERRAAHKQLVFNRVTLEHEYQE
jgi:hypothetical protein